MPVDELWDLCTDTVAEIYDILNQVTAMVVGDKDVIHVECAILANALDKIAAIIESERWCEIRGDQDVD